MSALVLALTGTDHHPFDRLVRWIDASAGHLPDLRFVVQHGAAAPPHVAEGHAFLPHDRMLALLEEATAVVCHGGPGTILDAREAGHVPLCVPRDPKLGEHVDGHQQRFVAVASRSGIVRAVLSAAALRQDLEEALARGPRPAGSAAVDSARAVARGLVASELDTLVVPRPRRQSRRVRAAARSVQG